MRWCARGSSSCSPASTVLMFVGAAADGEAAIEMARTLRPDVILMDLEMEGTDG